MPVLQCSNTISIAVVYSTSHVYQYLFKVVKKMLEELEIAFIRKWAK